MDNNLVRLKLKQRLNKLASNDYTNIECWQEAELINKGQLQIVRRNLHGGNAYREGDEQSKTRIDDFQILLTQKDLNLSNRGLFFESVVIPENYLRYKRVSVYAKSKDCADPRLIKVHLVQEENVDEFLKDFLRKPSFKWAETFCTLVGDKIRIYTNNEFVITSCKLTYYRFPKPIAFDSCRDWNDSVMTNSELEFNDDLVELIIDEAVSVAAADINDFNNYSRSSKTVETNN